MLRKRIKLHSGTPSFERVTANFVARLDAMSCERLVPSARQNPAAIFGENDSRDSSIMSEILLDWCQSVAVLGEEKL
jgi:hypothetical protein